ncbi:MAG: ATP-binding cassette domain-containing protein [Dysgonamonadaceae bacterium]|jgi:phospholipid/cholesterol/gamma-HCH transport system ATP-binding protein|nr:ATP-binding cassette domain-containing protein [Dysgonamonadaceae bacterium]MDD3357370.1 ATP-binding cassette domain-containing protein [Dysgonamonadaceae bacterium]MDD3728456.1 ATP-binding cassette domain-containing protein [Dysgonamonadaceae bacterium]
MILNQADIITNSSHAAHGDEAVIEIANLSKSFGDQEVLKDVSLKLFKGENLVVLGKSGSGKSVLIKCIVRLLNSDSGTINVFDKEIMSLNRDELSEVRKKIGFLFQSGALYDSMTVKQNLEFHLKRIKRELSKSEIEEKIAEVLKNVGLPDSMNRMPSELSGGMKKRISLARTIVVDPEIMLYDEPTTGLDPVTSDEISLLINEVQEKYKTSSIIITHDIAVARTNANRIVMLLDGKIYLEGNLEMFENSTDPNIKSFFK